MFFEKCLSVICATETLTKRHENLFCISKCFGPVRCTKYVICATKQGFTFLGYLGEVLLVMKCIPVFELLVGESDEFMLDWGNRSVFTNFHQVSVGFEGQRLRGLLSHLTTMGSMMGRRALMQARCTRGSGARIKIMRHQQLSFGGLQFWIKEGWVWSESNDYAHIHLSSWWIPGGLPNQALKFLQTLSSCSFWVMIAPNHAKWCEAHQKRIRKTLPTYIYIYMIYVYILYIYIYRWYQNHAKR